MEIRRHKVLVLGAGGWGTALAVVLHGNGHKVKIWAYEQDEVDNIRTYRENRRFLPGVTVPEGIDASTDMARLLAGVTLIVNATPAQFTRGVLHRLAACKISPCPVVNVAKGIENKTLKRMSQVMVEELPAFFHSLLATLSGPSHAEEVGRSIPTAVVAAAANPRIPPLIQQAFMCETLRVYSSDDLVGVELAGSIKNIIAVAAGICDGLGFGDNAKGALLTRGLAEISRLGVAMGAKPATFAGLAGMGDLVTTCTSRHSRNRYVGEQIGRGRKLPEILAEMVMVAEGVATTESAHALSRQFGVEMPITAEVYAALFEGKDPREAARNLMSRPAKPENW
ncbi:MAG TPA: NAD(P)H-dependent glycerol-3-phosphate dehydrogenase [Acidobacteriota bacterium]|nr:NAD(P)-dependent glycerol-3-phosphate dehydrogenase [Acidobacteriota bacterium]HNR38963.1 NAD(P)H-dependent glycerol-3-phosphate dehydrogenase [Acidobacteriota bacterium]HNU00888.1 NAD(P)H-dependent glycerol-3-phosphate dehydrogenase [Acidobacteriota bacterium]HOB51450.1 NAD(P)H-dependent glycerol-3-phosphate dehydrogenase [Acidobacteriota bacterium]HPB27536.1 NAD(P)H-dependent glycerol-3-phosphate dehydrogenase [Acidobacteriota bacterium]